MYFIQTGLFCSKYNKIRDGTLWTGMLNNFKNGDTQPWQSFELQRVTHASVQT